MAIKLTDYIVRRLPSPAKGNKIYYDSEVTGGKFNTARIECGMELLALRARIEAGEAGEIGWWEWYEPNSPAVGAAPNG